MPHTHAPQVGRALRARRLSKPNGAREALPNFPLLVLIAFMALFLATGCQSSYSERDVTSGPPPALRNNSRVYVAVPFDASFKKNVAAGSGLQTAETVRAAFLRYTKPVFQSKIAESMPEALESARKMSAEYLAYPSIVQWEDRATEWSGRRDRLKIAISLVEVETEQTLLTREITGVGKWMTDGGDTPKDLLGQPIEEFVNGLFRRTETPSALW